MEAEVKKIRKKVIAGIVCMIVVLVGIAIVFFGPSKIPTITSPTARKKVTVDGKVEANEWMDAKKVNISAEGYEAYLYTKNDNSNLYLALDVSGTNPPDGASFSFDWKKNNNLDGEHDTEYILAKGVIFGGFKLEFVRDEVHSYRFENSQAKGEYALANKHSGFEIKAPLEELYLKENVKVGLLVTLTRSEPVDNAPPKLHHVIDWPQGSNPNDPSTWADLRI